MIADNHHILRFCKSRYYDNNQKQFLPDFFKLRDRETYLSCNWCEFYDTDDKALSDMKLSISPKDCVPKINIGLIKEVGHRNKLKQISVKHEGRDSHSAIYNTSNDARFLSDMAQTLTNELGKRVVWVKEKEM